MKLREKKIALILIDIQKGFLDENYWGGNRNNKNAEQISGRILEKFRELNLPISILDIVHQIQIQNYIVQISAMNLMTMFYQKNMNQL